MPLRNTRHYYNDLHERHRPGNASNGYVHGLRFQCSPELIDVNYLAIYEGTESGILLGAPRPGLFIWALTPHGIVWINPCIYGHLPGIAQLQDTHIRPPMDEHVLPDPC